MMQHRISRHSARHPFCCGWQISLGMDPDFATVRRRCILFSRPEGGVSNKRGGIRKIPLKTKQDSITSHLPFIAFCSQERGSERISGGFP